MINSNNRPKGGRNILQTLREGRFKSFLQNAGQLAVSLGILYLLVEVFGKMYGVLGFILFLTFLGLLSLWRGRQFYMAALRNIETQIYGKPLDREYWKKGELKSLWKHRKLKIVWSKKQKGGNLGRENREISKVKRRDIIEVKGKHKGNKAV